MGVLPPRFGLRPDHLHRPATREKHPDFSRQLSELERMAEHLQHLSTETALSPLERHRVKGPLSITDTTVDQFLHHEKKLVEQIERGAADSRAAHLHFQLQNSPSYQARYPQGQSPLAQAVYHAIRRRDGR